VYGDCSGVVRVENHIFNQIEIYQFRNRVVSHYSPDITH
jgi:hypothetical protein